jgi:hypothetical protein
VKIHKQKKKKSLITAHDTRPFWLRPYYPEFSRGSHKKSQKNVTWGGDMECDTEYEVESEIARDVNREMDEKVDGFNQRCEFQRSRVKELTGS